MTDHELDAEMARLCGIPTYTWDEAFGIGSDVVRPFICGGYLRVEAANGGTRWHPAGDWNEVNDYVIPALRRRGCDVSIDYAKNDEVYVTITPSGLDDWLVSKAAVDPKPPPRFVCEAARETWMKLEADSAN